LDSNQKVDVAILATVSDLPRISPQIISLVEAGLPVVSTCEELFFPWENNHAWSETIDRAAKDKQVAVLGTGVNPGFLMDTLPTMLSAVCNHVEKIEVRRYQDAQFRRIPFQKKIGAGLNFEEFEKRRNEGSLRHVGLSESMHFIAKQLGWSLEKTEDKIEPVIADRNIQTESLNIISGLVAGVRQTGRAWVNGEEKIRLIFQASVGEPDSYDEIEIFGTPHIRSRILGGVNGDVATCSIILNACHSIRKAMPGLRTMADIPMISGKG
jgi:4-hydroxy-tetrahydrodipicolinate reductase